MNLRIGHFLADGELIYLPIGYIPDFYVMDKISGGDGAVHQAKWYYGMESDEASGSREGWTDQEGTTDVLADTAGISSYNTGSQKPAIAVWRADQTALLNKVSGASITVVARSATAPGTFTVGTTSGVNDLGQVVDREAIFECVTAGTTDSTEPAWPTAIGGQVTDNTTVWERVNEPTKRGGYQGVCIAAALMTDSDRWYYRAFKSDNGNLDHGDVDGWPDGIDPNWK